MNAPFMGVLTMPKFLGPIAAALGGDIDLRRDLRASPHIQEGTFWVMNGQILCHHESEFWTAVAGARWHVRRDHCPTWDDGAECRCMLGGEA